MEPRCTTNDVTFDVSGGAAVRIPTLSSEVPYFEKALAAHGAAGERKMERRL